MSWYLSKNRIWEANLHIICGYTMIYLYFWEFLHSWFLVKTSATSTNTYSIHCLSGFLFAPNSELASSSISASIQNASQTPLEVEHSPWKITIPKKESSLPTIIFWGQYVKLLGSIPVLQSVFNRWKGVPHNALALCCLRPEGNSPSGWRASWMVWIVSCVFFHPKAVYPIPSQLVSLLPCAFYSAAPATMSVNTRDATSKSGRWEQLRLVLFNFHSKPKYFPGVFWWC